MSETMLHTVKRAVMTFLDSQVFVHILLFTVSVIWGFFYVFSTWSLKEMHPFVFTTIRSAIGVTVLFPMFLIADRNYKHVHSPKLAKFERILSRLPNWQNLLLLMLSGILSIGISQTSFVVGMQFTSALVGAIFQPISSIFTCVFAILLKQEGKSWIKILGILVSVVGSIIMVFATTDGGQTPDPAESGFVILGIKFSLKGMIGIGFYLLNTLSFALVLNVQGILLRRTVPSVTVTFYTMLFGTICIFLIALYFLVTGFNLHLLSWKAWVGVVYSGTFGGTIAASINTYATKKASPSMVSIYSMIVPLVITAILTYLFFGTFIPWYGIAGAFLIIGGVLLVIYGKSKEEQQMKKEQEQQAVTEIPKEPEDETTAMINDHEAITVEPVNETKEPNTIQ